MALDKTDHKILWNLDYNARLSLTELAKKVGLSKQNLNYRLQKLIKEKVILRFTTLFNIHKLGYHSYRIYFRYKNVDEKKEKEIIEYFQKEIHVIWLVTITGSWDLEAAVVARNDIHLNNIFKKIKEDLGVYFSKYNVSSSMVNYHFPRDYLIDKKRERFTPYYYGFEPEKIAVDELDLKIMEELAQNSRQNNQEIGRKLDVTYHTIQNRIKELEKKKIIQGHRILIDLEKIGRRYQKAAIFLNNPTPEQEQKLYTFCSQFNVVAYLVEVLGEWQFEIETEVQNQDEFIDLLRKIRNEFSDLIVDYDILLVTKEHKLNYLPMGEELVEKASSRKHQ